MNIKAFSLVLYCVVMVFADCQSAEKKRNCNDVKKWTNRVIPLPHEVTVTGSMIVPIKDVQCSGAVKAPQQTIISKLLKPFPDKCQSPAVNIKLGLVSDSGLGVPANIKQRLSGLPNKDQAYAIISSSQGGNLDIILTANTGKGLLYATRTFMQMLRFPVKIAPETRIEIPIVNIIDWPDIGERGIWGGWMNENSINWLAARKLNFIDYALSYGRLGLKRGPDGPICNLILKADLIKYAKSQGITYMPRITHLDWLTQYKQIREAYPEILGVGVKHSKIGRGGFSPCASNPLLKKILAGWMESAAKRKIDEMAFWTTEYDGHCKCPKCINENQHALEARAIIAAWREVRKKYPDFKVRIFVSTDVIRNLKGVNPPDTLKKIIKEIPPEIGIERACYGIKDKSGMLTDPEFDKIIKDGYRLYSFRTNIGYYNMRFAVTAYKPYYNALIKRGWLGGVAWMVIPLNIFSRDHSQCKRIFDDVQVDGLAEWSWNNNGRTIKEFAVAFATCNNYRHPEKFGEWVEIMPRFALNFNDDKYRFKLVVTGKSRIPSEKTFSKLLARCAKGMALAQEIGEPAWILESKIITAKIRMNKIINRKILKDIQSKERSREKLKADLAEFEAQASVFSRLLKERGSYYGIKCPRFTGWPMKKFNNYVAEVKSAMEKLIANHN